MRCDARNVIKIPPPLNVYACLILDSFHEKITLSSIHYNMLALVSTTTC